MYSESTKTMMLPPNSFAGRTRFLLVLCQKDWPCSVASNKVIKFSFPVSFLNRFAFRLRIVGGKVSRRNIMPSTRVDPVQNTKTHIVQRHVVLSEMKPAIMGATVGAIGGPSENIAIALPLSFASHISASTPA